MHSERKLNVSLSMKIKGESTSVKVFCHVTHLQHLMWPCWFILLFISGVPSARRFYFFIRSVRAFGTTRSLLFISFTKPSMTTLPSLSSKVKPCFLFEWYCRAQGTKTQVLILNAILKSLFYFICFVLVEPLATKMFNYENRQMA